MAYNNRQQYWNHPTTTRSSEKPLLSTSAWRSERRCRFRPVLGCQHVETPCYVVSTRNAIVINPERDKPDLVEFTVYDFAVLRPSISLYWHSVLLISGHGLCDRTAASKHLGFCFSFFFTLFCSVPCGRLSWLLVSLWANVNVVYCIVSCLNQNTQLLTQHHPSVFATLASYFDEHLTFFWANFYLFLSPAVSAVTWIPQQPVQ